MKLIFKKVLSPGVLVLTDQVIFSGGNFLSTLLLARILNVKDFGIYSAVVLHGYLLMSLGNALCIQPLQVATRRQQGSIVYSSFLFFLQLAFMVFALGFSLLFASSFGLLHLFNAQALALLAGILLQDFIRKFLLSRQRFLLALVLDATVTIPQLLILITGIFSITVSVKLMQFFCIAYFLPVFAFVIWLKPTLKHMALWPGLLIRQFRQSGWYSVVAFIQWGASNVFVVSVGVFISMEALGAFRLIQSLFGVLNILFQSFENYVLPSASRLYHQSAEASKHYIQNMGRRSILLIGVLLAVLFAFAGPVLNTASGGRYTGYAYVLRGMCLLYFVLFISYPVRLSIRVLLLNRDFFIGYLLSFLFSLAFFNLFIRQWMLGGVVAGLITSQLIMLGFWLYRLNKNKFYLWK